MKTEEKKQLHKEFWQGKGPSLILVPQEDSSSIYDMNSYSERFYNPQKMWESEISRAERLLEWPTDGIPTVRPNLGTIFIPAVAGQSFTVRDGQMPWPGQHFSIEQISAVNNVDISSAKLMELTVKFYEIHKSEGRGDICSYSADTQGIFDVLHLLRGNELFYELVDKKDRMKELLETITDLYIDISRQLKRCIGEDSNSMIHGHGTPQGLYFPNAGVRLSEDTPTLLSPDMIDEFVLPYMEKAAKPFGGAFVHFCGRHGYLYEKVLECDFVKAIDLGNPEMYDTRWLLERCAETNTVFYGKLAAQDGESWRDYVIRLAGILKDTGARCVLRPVVFPDNLAECEQILNFWHELTL